MPTPLRGSTTPVTTPTTPGAPAVPATPATPATPAAPARNPTRDLYSKAPKALKAQPQLPGVTALGDFGGAQVSVLPDGMLSLGAVPTSLTEQIRAAKVAVSQAPDNQPFANVTDVRRQTGQSCGSGGRMASSTTLSRAMRSRWMPRATWS